SSFTTKYARPSTFGSGAYVKYFATRPSIFVSFVDFGLNLPLFWSNTLSTVNFFAGKISIWIAQSCRILWWMFIENIVSPFFAGKAYSKLSGYWISKNSPGYFVHSADGLDSSTFETATFGFGSLTE